MNVAPRRPCMSAECDILTIVHGANRQEPTVEPGNFYEVSPLTRSA
jgi:hypothetical protein